MSRKRVPRRITTIIAFYTSLIMAVNLAIMGFVSYYYSYENLRTRTISDAEVILEQVGKNIGRYVTSIENLSSIVNVNNDLMSYLSGDYSSVLEERRYQSNYESLLQNVPEITDGVEAIFVFNEANEVVYKPENIQMKTGYDITQEKWFKKIENNTDNTAEITGTQVRVMTEKNNPWVISLSSRVTNQLGEVVGTQLIELNYRVIEEILRDVNIGAKGYIFIINEDGNYVYHPQLQLIFSEYKTENIDGILQAESTLLENPDENKLYRITNIPGTDFKMVGVMFMDEIVSASREMLTVYVLLTLVMGLAGFVVSVQMAKNVTAPLHRLEQTVREVEDGDLNADFDIKGTYETEMVAQSLGSMVNTIKQLMNQIVEDQEKIRSSELKALQSQINPHFLYNTLDSIVWISEEAGNDEITEITVALANYFRIVLSSGKEFITIREEIQHVENYLIIQKKRYETLEYHIDIDPSMEDAIMPKLLLQPIVENAIYHGVKYNRDGGNIWIHGFKQEQKIMFEIEDDGRGMRPEELESIYDEKIKLRPRGGGVGLQNIRDRIELYYGMDYSLSVDSVYRKGTIVTLTLPERSREDYHAEGGMYE